MLRVSVIIAFISFVVFDIPSRSQAIENTESLTHQEIEIIGRAEELSSKAWNIRKSFPDSTLHYCNQAIELYKQVGQEQRVAKLYNFIGVAYYYKGENLLSYDYYVKAHHLAEQTKDSVQFGHAMNNLGRIFANQGDFLKAYDYGFKALSTFEFLGNDDGVAYALKRIGELYLSQREFEKAIEVTERAMAIREEENDVGSQAYVHLDFANIYIELGQFDEALNNYNEANDKANMVGDIILLADINLGIAQLYYRQKSYSKALDYALVALYESNKVNNIDLSNRVLLTLGKTYYELELYEQAHNRFLELKVGLNNSNQLALESELFNYLSKIHYLKGEGSKAYEFHVQHSKLSDSLTNTEARKEFSRIEFNVELERRKRENELLKENQEKDQATISNQRTSNVALIIVGVIVLLLAIVATTTSIKRKKTNEELRLKNESIIEQRQEIELRNQQISQQNVELQLRNIQLAELNNEKDTLMNIVAHDLKAPINRIMGMAQLLETTSLNEEQREYVKMLDTITQGNLDLIRDLLDVTAFEGERRRLNISEVDLSELLEERVSEFEGDALAKKIALNLQVDSSGTKINTDKEYVSRILDNLISNALKFSDKKSKVELSIMQSNGKAQLSIKDYGQGFTEEDKKNLFKKFTKLSATPTAGENSNGLGLALVKTLVDQLGGEIHLNSKAGEGSEFIVTLPNN